MNHHLLDDEDDLPGRTQQREITLSTSAILGIFFGLALICALFFGFGYNMGRKSAQPTIAADGSDEAPASTNFNSFKPAAGSPVAGQPVIPLSGPGASTPAGAPATTPAAPIVRPTPPHAPEDSSSTAPAAVMVSPPPPSRPVAVAAPAATEPPPAGSFVVQVAAVSHQEDAELLVGALHQKGYAVAARSEPQDKLVHIQVGPFNNRKDADAMRQRLLADGYNAIVK